MRCSKLGSWGIAAAGLTEGLRDIQLLQQVVLILSQVRLCLTQTVGLT